MSPTPNASSADSAPLPVDPALRKRILETNYGRDAGWFLEQWGEPIALLTDCESVEMFWDSYLLTPITEDAGLLAQLYTADFWNKMEGLEWRNREFGLVAPHAFPGGFHLRETGRVSMRGLYIDIDPPSPPDYAGRVGRVLGLTPSDWREAGYIALGVVLIVLCFLVISPLLAHLNLNYLVR